MRVLQCVAAGGRLFGVASTMVATCSVVIRFRRPGGCIVQHAAHPGRDVAPQPVMDVRLRLSASRVAICEGRTRSASSVISDFAFSQRIHRRLIRSACTGEADAVTSGRSLPVVEWPRHAARSASRRMTPVNSSSR